jgi:hypothetical protein
MRSFLRAMKVSPHPELVEGRRIAVQDEDVNLSQADVAYIAVPQDGDWSSMEPASD